MIEDILQALCTKTKIPYAVFAGKTDASARRNGIVIQKSQTKYTNLILISGQNREYLELDVTGGTEADTEYQMTFRIPSIKVRSLNKLLDGVQKSNKSALAERIRQAAACAKSGDDPFKKEFAVIIQPEEANDAAKAMYDILSYETPAMRKKTEGLGQILLRSDDDEDGI